MALSGWSDLHPDLLGQIATRVIQLNEFEDFMAFRGVCSSWRGSTTKDKLVPKKHRIPLLMIPAKRGGDSDICEFYSWRKKKIASRMAVPESRNTGYTSVGFGWILTYSFSGKLTLLNSMFSGEIQLPKMITSVYQAVLSADPSQSSYFVLVVVTNCKLRFWRNGDSKWTEIETIDEECLRVKRICYYKNKLFVIDYAGCVWMCDISYLSRTIKIEQHSRFKASEFEKKHPYFVESSKGELLVILDCFRIYQIDTVKKEYRGIQSLDGDAIFITSNASAVSVAAADFPGVVKPNCIYYLDYWSTHMKIYDVEHKIELVNERLDLDVENSRSNRSPRIFI